VEVRASDVVGALVLALVLVALVVLLVLAGLPSHPTTAG
jgi:hypothetical protein